ncbi:DUF6495 family protein [Planktosalinus lacus]|uniref:Histidyl-tRNA synthetase n=1 Tax=Planktosalinus lacus TaxID=1526573 RepID=A0A8J2VB36_9FLAO|nr:DUF6495 family protein [Planktosalinus lacus]GGD97447.1 hypothetical protein GCM10011312_21280 [Planktosalinus lacus]
MKYSRLTKEQFESLHEEFTRFLASQSITADEWEKIKKETPQVAEDELDVFSDLIWEATLSKVEFLENWSQNQVYLFAFGESQINLIAVKIKKADVDLLTNEGIQWLEKNIGADEVELYEGTKNFNDERKIEIFDYIKEGAIITDGGFYNTLRELL